MKINWSQWYTMPAPENCKKIEGPKGPGVYQIKNRKSDEYIQFGESVNCQKRMKSFFPKPYGTGTRNNESKRIYIFDNWKDLDYRTAITASKEDAVKIDRYLKSLIIHKFNNIIWQSK